MSVTDLSFRPVENTSPKILTEDQIAAYNKLGYINPCDVFTQTEAVQNRTYFDSLLTQVPDTGAYSINCYQGRCAGIWDLCTEPRILDLVEDIIGPNIICWASHFFCKMPLDPKHVPWHQDATYWKLSPARTVTVWLAIDDTDDENANMRFIPETHKLGPIKTRSPDGDAVLRLETSGATELGTPFSNKLRAGQVSLHADMLVHGSNANESSRRRCGLTLRYCPPEVDFTDDEWAASVEPIICRGQDPFGRWKHNVRPEGNNVKIANGPHNIGGN